MKKINSAVWMCLLLAWPGALSAQKVGWDAPAYDGNLIDAVKKEAADVPAPAGKPLDGQDAGLKLDSKQATSAIIKLTKANFDKEVKQASVPVYVYYYKETDALSMKIMVVVEYLAKQNPQVKFGKVEIIQEPDLAKAMNVTKPTFYLFKEGKTYEMELLLVVDEKGNVLQARLVKKG